MIGINVTVETREWSVFLNERKDGQFDFAREGWLADIILIDRSGFNWKPDFNDVSIAVYAANSRDVDTVIINGKPVMINKELLTIDTERLDYEVNRVVKELYGDLN